MEPKDWFSTLAVIVAFGSLIVAILSFKRNRRIDSENLLFRYKSEGYAFLLEKLATIMDKILEEQKSFQHLTLNTPGDLIKELNSKADKFDLLIGDFGNDIIRHSLFFSKEINTELDSFSSFLYEAHDNSSLQPLEDIRKQLEEHYNDFLLKADRLVEMMRKDLHVDQINASLARRLRGTKI